MSQTSQEMFLRTMESYPEVGEVLTIHCDSWLLKVHPSKYCTIFSVFDLDLLANHPICTCQKSPTGTDR